MKARREHGFALLIVLWSLVLLSFLMTQMLASGRTALNLAVNSRAAAQQRAVAEGAMNEAVFHVLASGAAHWPADGAWHTTHIGPAAARVRLLSLAGMVNPNIASAALLKALMQAAGVTPDQANGLASAIVAWRSPASSADARAALLNAYRCAGLAFAPAGHAFADIGELSDVIGMTPGTLAKLTPHLSLFQPADPDLAAADPVVRRALLLASAANPVAGVSSGAPVVTILACAAGADAAAAPHCRRAIVGIAAADKQPPFHLLALDDAQ